MSYSLLERYNLMSACNWVGLLHLSSEFGDKPYERWSNEDLRAVLDHRIAKYHLSPDATQEIEEKALLCLRYIEEREVFDHQLKLDAEKILCLLDRERKATTWIDETRSNRGRLAEFLSHAQASHCDSCSVYELSDGAPELIASYASRSFTGRSNVHSTTKSLVGLAIFMLHDRGLVDLRVPVSLYLPEEWRKEGRWSELPKKKISTLHLLTHTSGLVEAIEEGQRTYTERSAFRDVDEVGPAPFKGERRSEKNHFRYSNYGVQLLGAVIEGATGRGAAEFIEEEILKPLQMNNTLLRPTFGGGVVLHGDMVSSPKDLASLASLVLNGGSLYGHKLLSHHALDLMLTPSTAYFEAPIEYPGFFDWRCCSLWYRYPMLNAYGTCGDYGNEIHVVPDEKLVVVRTQDWPPRPMTSCVSHLGLLV